eukprot:scaffold5238_cov177-Amphora_coffeaeformis.AAC.10
MKSSEIHPAPFLVMPRGGGSSPRTWHQDEQDCESSSPRMRHHRQCPSSSPRLTRASLFLLLLVVAQAIAHAEQRQFLRGERSLQQEPEPTPQTSVLWGKGGELWDPENSLLRDYTNCGYALGNEAIPEWPVWDRTIYNFGGIPNDNVSDVEALRRAIAACPLNHTLLVPNGRWIIDEALVISRNNIVIKGESRDGAILFFSRHMSEIQKRSRSNSPLISFGGGELRGIESISLILRDEQKGTGYSLEPGCTKQCALHWYYVGEKMVSFNSGETNSWMRNVYIKNSNDPITINGKGTGQISVLDIVMDDFMFRRYDGDTTSGHMGIHVGASPVNNLIHNILFTGSYEHSLAIMGTQHSTFSRIKGPNLELDHHAQGNSYNLFTEVDAGLGGRGFGGSSNNFIETYWGIKGELNDKYYPSDRQCVMVGITTDEPTSIGDTWHHETLDPGALMPPNLYLAQMAKKPGKWTPPDFELTLPPPPGSDQALQLLPVDDAGVWDGNGGNDNNGLSGLFTLRKGSREGYMKFDFRELDLGNLVHASLRIYGKLSANWIDVEIREVSDDSWSERTLNWNNKPEMGSVLHTMRLEAENLPAWIDLDITNFVKGVIADDKVASIAFAATESGSFNVNCKEEGNPTHLLLYLDESMVPPPEMPTGLVATGGPDYVALEWNVNTDKDMLTYNVYRQASSGNDLFAVDNSKDYKLEAMGLITPTYTDYVVASGQTYLYKVSAVDFLGVESVQSEYVSASLCSDCAPTTVEPPSNTGWCLSGTTNGKFCCGECDGQCGDTGCGSRTGGAMNCCVSRFTTVCSDVYETACILPEDTDSDGEDSYTDDDFDDPYTDDPYPEPSEWCLHGSSSGRFCCAECDGICGGSGCDGRTGGSWKCCTSYIKAQDKVCADSQDTVCIIPDPVGDTDPDPDSELPLPVTQTSVIEESACLVHTKRVDCRRDSNCFWNRGTCEEDCPRHWPRWKCIWRKGRLG